MSENISLLDHGFPDVAGQPIELGIFHWFFVGLEWLKQIEFYWLLSGIFYSPFIGYATARFDLSDYKQLVVGESKSDSLGTGFVHLETKRTN